MNSINVIQPIGLEPMINLIQAACKQAKIYNRCGEKPGPFIINLDAGNGQTTLTTYAAEMFYNAGIRPRNGREIFLEFTLEGTMSQLKTVIGEIKANAEYGNGYYDGLIGIDIAKLDSHLNEAQTALFCEVFEEISRQATLLLYVPSSVSKNTAFLISRLRASFGEKLQIVNLSPYTKENMADIVRRIIEDTGTELEQDDDNDRSILSAVENMGVKSVKDAKVLTKQLLSCADFERTPARLSAYAIFQMLDSIVTRTGVIK
jgi:hypothetical protein